VKSESGTGWTGTGGTASVGSALKRPSNQRQATLARQLEDDPDDVARAYAAYYEAEEQWVRSAATTFAQALPTLLFPKLVHHAAGDRTPRWETPAIRVARSIFGKPTGSRDVVFRNVRRRVKKIEPPLDEIESWRQLLEIALPEVTRALGLDPRELGWSRFDKALSTAQAWAQAVSTLNRMKALLTESPPTLRNADLRRRAYKERLMTAGYSIAVADAVLDPDPVSAARQAAAAELGSAASSLQRASKCWRRLQRLYAALSANHQVRRSFIAEAVRASVCWRGQGCLPCRIAICLRHPSTVVVIDGDGVSLKPFRPTA